MTRVSDLREPAMAVIVGIRQSQVTFLAAAIAFYGFVSIIPLFLLGLAVVQFVDASMLSLVMGEVAGFLTPDALDIVRSAATDRAGSGGATVVSLGFLAWSGLKVFRGLDVAFSQVYGVGGPEPLAKQLLDAAIALVAIPVAVVAAAVLGVVLPLFDWVPFLGLLGRLSLVPVLMVAFFPIYYRFPDVSVSPRAALPGTVVAAVGWAVLATGFSLYASVIGQFRLYGILGAGLFLVTWLYLGGIIIMVGAVLNAVLAGGPDETASTDRTDSDRTDPAPDIGSLARQVDALREDVDAKTVSRSDLEGDLEQYVRRRIRRGKARGWGPYLVLLYGTAMTLGAFYWLSGGWAILAMIVVWLSTLGLYVLMVLFGLGLNAAGVPGRVLDAVRNLRS